MTETNSRPPLTPEQIERARWYTHAASYVVLRTRRQDGAVDIGFIRQDAPRRYVWGTFDGREGAADSFYAAQWAVRRALRGERKAS